MLPATAGERYSDAYLGRDGPVGESRILITPEANIWLFAGGGTPEMACDVLHTLVPGISTVELFAATNSRALHVGGQLATLLSGDLLVVFEAFLSVLGCPFAPVVAEVHPSNMLCVEILTVEDAANRRDTRSRRAAVGVQRIRLTAMIKCAVPVV